MQRRAGQFLGLKLQRSDWFPAGARNTKDNLAQYSCPQDLHKIEKSDHQRRPGRLSDTGLRQDLNEYQVD